mgnify:CR=1 FL=1
MLPSESLALKDEVMAGAFDNIHPGLSQQEALRLLLLPVGLLESQSDPYMAAAHLINFPGAETEAALIALVVDQEQAQPRRLARRKAVEVLGRLGSQQSLPAIGDCLSSDDSYLVENAAVALQQLNCADPSVHQKLRELLADPAQNRRVLIQSLAGLGVLEALPEIRELLSAEDPGVRGAAISATAQLDGGRDQLMNLAEQMLLPNQMDRQSAIQDVINAGGHELLPAVLRSPVSPVFRMRAVRALWPEGVAVLNGLELISVLDALIEDRPQSLQLVHAYDQEPTDAFLVQEFFGTDFSRSYLALQTLQLRSAAELWPLLLKRWYDEAHNDYGAHYFFIRLFGSLQGWPTEALPLMRSILEEAIVTRRPQFMKSKPAAVLAMASLGNGSPPAIWLDPAETPFWEVRYATLMLAPKNQAEQACSDPHPFVAAKARAVVDALAPTA